MSVWAHITVSIISGLVAMAVGATITWYVARWYYRKATTDLWYAQQRIEATVTDAVTALRAEITRAQLATHAAREAASAIEEAVRRIDAYQASGGGSGGGEAAYEFVPRGAADEPYETAFAPTGGEPLRFPELPAESGLPLLEWRSWWRRLFQGP